MKKKILFKGCGTAICTPFDKDGVNLKEFEKLLENQIQNKADAIINLVKEFSFTEKQATAIVMLQLYRLTNTDITDVQNEMNNLKNAIKKYELILSDVNELKKVIKEELRKVKKEFSVPR